MTRGTALRRCRSAAIAGASVIALGLLATLALTGSPPGARNLVPFRSRGVLSTDPQHVTQLEVRAGTRRSVLVRDGARWRPAAGDTLGAPDAGVPPSRVDAAIGFLHDSAPVRTLAPGEYAAADLRDFGLDPPGMTVTLFDAGGAVFRVEFGALNPMRSGQYVRVGGRDGVYLLPRFVGREWELVGPR